MTSVPFTLVVTHFEGVVGANISCRSREKRIDAKRPPSLKTRDGVPGVVVAGSNTSRCLKREVERWWWCARTPPVARDERWRGGGGALEHLSLPETRGGGVVSAVDKEGLSTPCHVLSFVG